MALAPGTKLNNGAYIGAGGEVVFPGLSDPDQGYVMVNGQFVPYTPPTTVTRPDPEPRTVNKGNDTVTYTYEPAVSSAALAASASLTPTASSGGGGSPAALGFDLYERSFDMMLRAEQARQQSIDQSLNIAQLFVELERASPTRAADLAVRLGLPGLEPDLSLTKAFTNAQTMGSFGGKVGSQDVRLPFSFSGQELSFLDRAPQVASIFRDIGDRFGLSNVLESSAANLIPAGRSLISLAGG